MRKKQETPVQSMLVGGKLTPGHQVILAGLALPSAFPEHEKLYEQARIQEVIEFQKKGMEHSKNNNFIQAIQDLEKSITVNDSRNKQQLSRSFAYIGVVYLKNGKLDKAEEYFTASLEIDDSQYALHWLGDRYKILAGAIYLEGIEKYSSKFERLKKEMADKTRPKHQQMHTILLLSKFYEKEYNYAEASKLFSLAHNLSQGPEYPEALNIGQRELGFSDSVPIGTENVQNCIGVLLYIASKHEFRVAHIDRQTEEISLHKIFEGMMKNPYVEEEVKQDLTAEIPQLHIFGGNRLPSSTQNLSKFLRVASQYQINIASMDIRIPEIDEDEKATYHSHHPTCVVAFPETGKIIHAFPGAYEPSKQSLIKSRIRYYEESPIRVSFDMREDRRIQHPILVKRSVNKQLIADVVQEGNYNPLWNLGNSKERIAAIEAWSKSQTQLTIIAGNRLNELNVFGWQGQESDELIEELKAMPRYIAADQRTVSDLNSALVRGMITPKSKTQMIKEGNWLTPLTSILCCCMSSIFSCGKEIVNINKVLDPQQPHDDLSQTLAFASTYPSEDYVSEVSKSSSGASHISLF